MLTSIRKYPYLKPFYVSSFLGELYFIIPIWLFFYLRIINYQQAALLTIIQAITSVILEIPTGAFADLFGKRITLIISFLVWSVTNFMYVFSTSFSFFVGLEIVKGFAKAMYSGSFEAIVYDTMVEKNNEVEYPVVVSDFTTLSWIGLFISAYTGGFLYEINPFLPYILTSAVYFFIGLIFIFKVKEPGLDLEKYNLSLSLYVKQNVQGFRELFKNRDITFLSVLLITISLGYYVASEFLGLSQAKDYGFTPGNIGILFGTGYILSAIFSQFYPKLEKRFAPRALIIICSVILMSSFIVANFVGALAGAFLILARISSSTIFINLKSTLVNKNISSRNRATALSTMSLFVILPYSIILIWGGGFIDRTSPNYFAFIWGCIFTAMLFLLFAYKIAIKSNKVD